MIPSKHSLVLAGIVCLGLTLRLLHFWSISQTAFPQLPLVLTESDMFFTVEWARTILAGDWLGWITYHPHVPHIMEQMAPRELWYRWWGGQAIFHQAPLYPYWVAGLFACLGESLTGVLLVQLLVGALDSLVLYALTRRLFNPQIGLVAAGMTACYGPFIFHQGTLLRDWLPPLLQPLALLMILLAHDTGRARDWFLAGGAIGVALLAKESFLLFLPFLFLWLSWEYRHTWPQLARAGGMLVLGLAMTFSPLIVRNTLVGAPPLAISNRAIEGFILGNAPDSDPFGYELPPSLPIVLTRADGSFPKVVQETLRLYRGDWFLYAKLMVLKLRGLLDPIEIPSNLNFNYGAEISPILRVTLPYGLVFPLGLAGFLLSLPNWRRHSLLLLYGLSTFSGLLSMIIVGRYRLVLVPVLLIYGAASLVTLFGAIRLRQWPAALACTALIAGTAALQHLVVPLPELRTNPQFAIHPLERFHSAALYRAEERNDLAIEEMVRFRNVATRSLSRSPRARQMIELALAAEGDSRIRWANQLFQQNRNEDAINQVSLAQATFVEYSKLMPESTASVLAPFGSMDSTEPRVFFTRLLLITPEGPDTEAIRTLLTWLK